MDYSTRLKIRKYQLVSIQQSQKFDKTSTITFNSISIPNMSLFILLFRIPSPTVELSNKTSVRVRYSRTLSNFIVDHFPFLSPKLLLQLKKVSKRFENLIDKNFQNLAAVKSSTFDEKADEYVWNVDNLSAFSHFAFRVSIVLSENFPEISGIYSEPSSVVKTGLSDAVASAPVVQSVQQVRKRVWRETRGLYYKTFCGRNLRIFVIS